MLVQGIGEKRGLRATAEEDTSCFRQRQEIGELLLQMGRPTTDFADQVEMISVESVFQEAGKAHVRWRTDLTDPGLSSELRILCTFLIEASRPKTSRVSNREFTNDLPLKVLLIYRMAGMMNYG